MAILTVPFPHTATAPRQQTVRIEASAFQFSPAEIFLNPNDQVTIELVATDVIHGLSVDGHGLELRAEPGQPARGTLVANRSGVIRFRCSVPCGNLHPFMIGKLYVGSNELFIRGILLSLLSVLAAFSRPVRPKHSSMKPQQTVRHLLRNRFGHNILLNRWPQTIIRAITLAGLLFTILTGLLGTPVGSHNFAIIFVWIAWWSLLKLGFIPLGGRLWCNICPIPLPGEWLQNKGILKARNKLSKPGKRWPRTLRGAWLQAGSFVFIGLFGALILTSPRATAWVLLMLFVVAFLLSLIFERRAFCQHLCPIGGFSGLYAQAAPVEIRVIEASICARHSEKNCYEVCPWGQYPLAMKTNTRCGFCMECIRACPFDNLALNLRPWGSDLLSESQRSLSETFLGLMMISTVIVDAALFLGPWGNLKNAALAIGSQPWFAFAGWFLLISLFLIPGFYTLAVWATLHLGKSEVPLRAGLIHHSPMLIPSGLIAWMAFTVAFASTKFQYILPAISDPFGWGWNLLGTVETAWASETTPFSLIVQALLLAIGLTWSIQIARTRCHSSAQAMPLILFLMGINVTMLWLLLG